ncbi:MAG: NTP transferase domain-containing protein [Christensenellales bacterium]|jgi:choline kinase
MKALILNSGTGSRMGHMTQSACKCMAPLREGVTVLDAQLDRLLGAGIRDICMTTGPFAKELEAYVKQRYPQARVLFVHNPSYAQTNYIYSIHLARQHLEGDLLMLHGDLVFDARVLHGLLALPHSAMVVHSTRPLPDKDFKAVLTKGKITKIGVEFFENAVAAQPLYKLRAQDWALWLEEIGRFCARSETGVYAENAFNRISTRIALSPFDAKGLFCGEIDTLEDLDHVRAIYDTIR